MKKQQTSENPLNQTESLQEKKARAVALKMMAKTFSNLTWLYYSVQDYDNALAMAQQEWTAFANLRMENPRTLVHIGTAQLKKQDRKEAAATFKKAVRMIQETVTDSNDADLISALLYQFSYLKMEEEARACRRMMVRFEKTMPYNADDYLALGEYYKLTGQQDSMVLLKTFFFFP